MNSSSGITSPQHRQIPCTIQRMGRRTSGVSRSWLTRSRNRAGFSIQSSALRNRSPDTCRRIRKPGSQT